MIKPNTAAIHRPIEIDELNKNDQSPSDKTIARLRLTSMLPPRRIPRITGTAGMDSFLRT